MSNVRQHKHETMTDRVVQLTDAQADEFTKATRELVRYESDLLHQRVTWLLQIQGLLFAALAFAWKESSIILTSLLAGLGMTTAVSIWFALSLYSPAVRGLQARWEELLTAEQQRTRAIIGLSSPSHGITRLLRPWRALPLVFVIAWAAVLIAVLNR